jgi:flagellar biosynthesis/type III secretory pathway protein FliH
MVNNKGEKKMDDRSDNIECRNYDAGELGSMNRRRCNPRDNATLGANVTNDSDCHHRCRNHFDDALEDAYNDGYRDGYPDGFEDGRTLGATEGYNQGYKDGYEKAKEEVLQFIKRNRCCRCCRCC